MIPVCGQIVPSLCGAVRPQHRYASAVRGPRTEAEHEARIVGAGIAAVGADLAPQRAPVVMTHHGAGAECVPPAVAQLHAQPPGSLAHLVDQQARGAGVVGDECIDVAVVVDIAERGAPAHLGQGERGTCASGDFRVATAAEIVEELVQLVQRIGVAGDHQFLDLLDGTVHGEDVQPAVVVVVEPGGAEAGVREARSGDAGGDAAILEPALAVVHIQRVGFLAQMGHEQIDVAVAVEVRRVDAHAGLRRAVPVDGHAGEQGIVHETPVALVEPELVGQAVVGHVDVDAPVAVEVGGRHAQRAAPGAGDTRGLADVFETSVAQIAKQAVFLAGAAQRSAVIAHTGGQATLALVVEVVLQVVAHVQVQPAVGIDVHERRAEAPSRVVDAGCGGHVREAPVALVAPQLVVAVVHDVQVQVAIVVDVAGSHAHAVAGGRQPGGVGHVGEAQGLARPFAGRAVVAVQAIGQRQRVRRRNERVVHRLALAEHVALDQVGVEVAVAVVVEQRTAGSHHLRKQQVARHAVEVDEIDTGLRGRVHEQGASGFRRRLGGLRTRRRDDHEADGDDGAAPGGCEKHVRRHGSVMLVMAVRAGPVD